MSADEDTAQLADPLIMMLSGLPPAMLNAALRAAERREYRERRLRDLEAETARSAEARLTAIEDDYLLKPRVPAGRQIRMEAA